MAAATVRFVHTSDWQLGLTRHFLEGEAQARYSGARLDAVRAIGALAGARGADFVVVAGDVFDSNLLASQAVRRALDALASYPVPVYLLPGNHDALNAATIYRSEVFLRECPPGVHVLDGPGPWPVAEGVELVAAPLTSNAPLADPTAEVVTGLVADGTRRILVAHGQVDVLDADHAEVSSVRLAPLEEALADGRLAYVALGDRHSRLSVGQSGLVHYSGTPEVTDFRERVPGDVLVVDLPVSEPATVSVERVGTWRFLEWQFDVDCADDIETLDHELSSVDDAARCVLRYALTGSLSLADHAHLEEVLGRHRDRYGALFEWDRFTDLVIRAADDELADLGVGGYVGSALAELGAAAGAEQHAGDALALFYRLAKGPRR